METALQALQSVNAALEELNSSGSTIPIVVKRLPPMQVASIRAKVGSYTEVVNVERELVNSLPEQSLGEVRGVLWHRCADSGGLECEPFIMLKHRVEFEAYMI